MNPFDGLLYGLDVAIQPSHLLAAAIGVLAGMIVGVLPGLGPTAGAAIILPLTFIMEPTAGIIVIAGIYYGVMYGGSITSILLNIPGEAASVVATFDGYPLARKGRAGAALFLTTLGSFVAGTICLLLVIVATPYVARAGLLFGPAEYFALTVGGLLVISRVTGGSLISGLLPMMIGLMLSSVGDEILTGTTRFTMGIPDLARGLDVVVVAIGIFGVAEMLRLSRDYGTKAPMSRIRVRDLTPTREELRRSVGPWLRGGPIGFFLGLIPGPSAIMASFFSYRVEKAVSRRKEEFGKGAVEGLVGPEAANNGAATSGMIPVLALALPFSTTLALILTALQYHGVQPGPLLMEQHPEIFWGVLASMIVGNILLVILNIPLIGVWVSFLRTPYFLLIPLVTMIAMIGAYTAGRDVFDLYVALALGVLGAALVWMKFQLAPLLIGFILGPLIEDSFRQSLYMSRGDIWYLFTQPIAATIWAVVAVGMLAALLLKLRRGARIPVPADWEA